MAVTQFDLFAKPPEPERPLRVSELNDRAAAMLEGKFNRVLVEGEISGFLAHRSGHWYFTLKDQDGQVQAACFKGSQRPGQPPPRDGDKVIVRGKLTIYSQRGAYQLVVDSVKPAGEGELLQQLEALKAKLAAEGLLAAEKKRALPKIIHNVGLITSPDGAAVRDFIRVAQGRDPTMRVLVIPTPVQGAGAHLSIAKAIRFASEHAKRLNLDVLVVARGGGSVEDLWSFNEESVARALADCAIPTVSAVGHEVDITLSDLVADVRAPTPSAAAQMTAADMRMVWRAFGEQGRRMVRLIRANAAQRLTRLQRAQLKLQDPMRRLHRSSQRIDELTQQMERALQQRLSLARSRIAKAKATIETRHPQTQVAQKARQLAAVERRLQQAFARLVHDRKQRLARTAARIDALSPLGVLGRGYAIALNETTGRAVRSVAEAPPGTALQIRVHDGTLDAVVKEKK